MLTKTTYFCSYKIENLIDLNEKNEILFYLNHFSKNNDFECKFLRKKYFDILTKTKLFCY